VLSRFFFPKTFPQFGAALLLFLVCGVSFAASNVALSRVESRRVIRDWLSQKLDPGSHFYSDLAIRVFEMRRAILVSELGFFPEGFLGSVVSDFTPFSDRSRSLAFEFETMCRDQELGPLEREHAVELALAMGILVPTSEGEDSVGLRALEGLFLSGDRLVQVRAVGAMRLLGPPSLDLLGRMQSAFLKEREISVKEALQRYLRHHYPYPLHWRMGRRGLVSRCAHIIGRVRRWGAGFDWRRSLRYVSPPPGWPIE
jgi:hypothetical protein